MKKNYSTVLLAFIILLTADLKGFSQCALPSNIVITGINSTTAAVNWDAVSGAYSYRTRKKKTAGGPWIYASSMTNYRKMVNNLPGVSYDVQVMTYCDSLRTDSSGWSASVSFSTTINPCATTGFLASANVTSSAANLNWGAISGAPQYSVYYRLQGTTTAWTHVTSATNSLSLSGLTSSTTYEWRVRTDCSQTTHSDKSSTATFTTLCAGATNIIITGITSSTATVSWDTVYSADSYRIRKKPSTDTQWIYSNSATQSRKLTNCIPNTLYDVQVLTYCDPSKTDSSGWSSTVQFTTAATCFGTTNLASANVTGTTADLSWDAVGGILNYQVYYRPGNVSTWTRVVSSTNSLSLTGLSLATPYFWRVKSKCSSSDYSNYSTVQSFTTQATKMLGQIPQAPFAVEVAPNPASQMVTIVGLNMNEQTAAIEVCDLTGKVIMTTQVAVDGESMTSHLDVSQLTKGVYFVTVKAGQQQRTTMLSVE